MANNFNRVNLPALRRKYRTFSYSPFSFGSDISASDLKGVTPEAFEEADRLASVVIPRFSETYASLTRGREVYYRRSATNGTNMPFNGIGYILLADAIATFLLSSGKQGRVIDVAFSSRPIIANYPNVKDQTVNSVQHVTEKDCLRVLAAIQRPGAMFTENEIKSDATGFVTLIKKFIEPANLSSDHSTGEYLAYLSVQRFARIVYKFFDDLVTADSGLTVVIQKDEYIDVPMMGAENTGTELARILRKYKEWLAHVTYLESLSLNSKLSFSTQKRDGNVFVTISSQYYEDILKAVITALIKPVMALSSYTVKFDDRFTALKNYLVHVQLLRCSDQSYPAPRNLLYALLSQKDIDTIIAQTAKMNLVEADLRAYVEEEQHKAQILADDFEELLEKLYYAEEGAFIEGFRPYRTYMNGQEKIYRLDHKGGECYSLGLGSYNGVSISNGVSHVELSDILGSTVLSELTPVVHSTSQTEFMGAPTLPGKSIVTKDGVVIVATDLEILEIRQAKRRLSESLYFAYDPLTGSVGVRVENNAYCLFPPSEGKDTVAFGSVSSRRQASGSLFECRKVDVVDPKADLLDVILALPARLVENGNQESWASLYLKQVEGLSGRKLPTWHSYQCRIVEHDETSFKLAWLLMSHDEDVRRIAAVNERTIFVPVDSDFSVLFDRKAAASSNLLLPTHVRLPRYIDCSFSIPRSFVSPFVLDIIDTRGHFRTGDARDGQPRCKITPAENKDRVNVYFHVDVKTDLHVGDRKLTKDIVSASAGQDTFVVDLGYSDVKIRQYISQHKACFCFVDNVVMPWYHAIAAYDSPIFQSGFTSAESIGIYLIDLMRSLLYCYHCSTNKQQTGSSHRPLAVNAQYVGQTDPSALLAEIADVLLILSREYDLSKLKIMGPAGFGYAHLSELLSALSEIGIRDMDSVSVPTLSRLQVESAVRPFKDLAKTPFEVAIFAFSEKFCELCEIIENVYRDVTGSSFAAQFESSPMMPVQFSSEAVGTYRRITKYRMPLVRRPVVADSVAIDVGPFDSAVAEFIADYVVADVNNMVTHARVNADSFTPVVTDRESKFAALSKLKRNSKVKGGGDPNTQTQD